LISSRSNYPGHLKLSSVLKKYSIKYEINVSLKKNGGAFQVTNIFQKIFGGAKPRKNGLVLSAGAAPGVAHIGVIKALLEYGIKIDFVAGSSIGALIGAYFAKTGEIKSLEERVLKMDWRGFLNLMDVDIFSLSRGFLKGDKVKNFVEQLIGDVEFKGLKIPMSIIASELRTGEEVVISSGKVVDAVRASISIPLVFVPVKTNDRVLSDGGSTNPLPVDVAKKMGADFIFASYAIPSLLHGRNIDKEKNGENVPGMIETFLQTMFTMQNKIGSRNLELADIVITPITKGMDFLEFFKARQAIDFGYELTKTMLSEHPELK
jgi:NTE family protein